MIDDFLQTDKTPEVRLTDKKIESSHSIRLFLVILTTGDCRYTSYGKRRIAEICDDFVAVSLFAEKYECDALTVTLSRIFRSLRSKRDILSVDAFLIACQLNLDNFASQLIQDTHGSPTGRMARYRPSWGMLEGDTKLTVDNMTLAMLERLTPLQIFAHGRARWEETGAAAAAKYMELMSAGDKEDTRSEDA